MQVVQHLERLFDQQMWAFGRDVNSPHGNLLAWRGLVRSPPPQGSKVSSTWTDCGEPRVALSSTGLILDGGGGLTLTMERGPLQKQLRDANEEPLRVLTRWCATYELNLQTAYPGWREASLGLRSKRPWCSANSMPRLWGELGDSRAWFRVEP